MTEIRVEGLSELNRALAQTSADVADLHEVHEQVGQLVTTAGRGNAPVLTGDLRESIRQERAKGKAVVVAGGGLVEYAAPVHWGWPARNIQPNHFLSPVPFENEAHILNLYDDGIEKVLRKNSLK